MRKNYLQPNVVFIEVDNDIICTSNNVQVGKGDFLTESPWGGENND